MTDPSLTSAGGADPQFDQAVRLFGEARYAEALALGRQGASRAPILNVAAAAADKLGDPALAEQLYRRALAIDPGFATGYNNLGLLLRNAGRHAESEAVLKAGIEIDPDMIELRHCLAGLYWLQRRFDLAEAVYRELIARRPEQMETRFRLGALLLTLGRFEEGWAFYEARYDPRRPEAPALPAFGCPQWRGEPLHGKSLLIWFEQGYGDEIQFCRYVPLLKAMGASVTLFCRPAMAPLLETLAGVDRLVPAMGTQEVPDPDYWTLLMSIPYRLGTTLETIPADVPYLAAAPDRRTRWAPLLPKGGKQVGLVWRGSPAMPADANRSLPGLAKLRPLWDVPGLSFVSLQKGAGEDEARTPPADQPLLDLGTRMADFADSAAIIDQLDLLITVDTAPAHLAGALGRPVWVLLPWIGLDGRWMLDREDSPWYPSMRLFRQSPGEGWDPVIPRLAEALRAWAAG